MGVDVSLLDPEPARLPDVSSLVLSTPPERTLAFCDARNPRSLPWAGRNHCCLS